MGMLHKFGDAVRTVTKDEVEARNVECDNCGYVFTTAKDPDEAQCGLCDSGRVRVRDA